MAPRTRVSIGNRLVWYSQQPDEEYWHDHWSASATPERYRSARENDLSRDELGSLILTFLQREGRLLEAGCGSGQYVAALSAAGFDVDGVDSSYRLVKLVNEIEPALAIRHADVLAMTEPDGYYQSYLSIGVVEHREAGPLPFLTEAHRLLAPHGRAVVSVPANGPLRRSKARLRMFPREPPKALSFYQYGFTPREISSIVEDAGFKVHRTVYTGLHRLLSEEIPGYQRATNLRGGTRLLKETASRMFSGLDGHMVVVLAERRPS